MVIHEGFIADINRKSERRDLARQAFDIGGQLFRELENRGELLSGPAQKKSGYSYWVRATETAPRAIDLSDYDSSQRWALRRTERSFFDDPRKVDEETLSDGEKVWTPQSEDFALCAEDPNGFTRTYADISGRSKLAIEYVPFEGTPVRLQQLVYADKEVVAMLGALAHTYGVELETPATVNP